RLVELLKQPLNSPMPVEEQVVSIYAGTTGLLDDLPVGDVRRFEADLLEAFRTEYRDLLDHIRTEKTLPDGLLEAVQAEKARCLSGAYNSSVIRAAEGEVKDDALRNVGYSLVLVGRKAESYYRFRGYDIDAVFTGFTETPTYEDARAIGETVVDLYQSGEVDS